MTSPSPAPLNLSFAETGPIPDNQCALKDALLLAFQTGETDPATIVTNARVFLDFLAGAQPVNAGPATPPPPMSVPEPALDTANPNLDPATGLPPTPPA